MLVGTDGYLDSRCSPDQQPAMLIMAKGALNGHRFFVLERLFYIQSQLQLSVGFRRKVHAHTRLYLYCREYGEGEIDELAVPPPNSLYFASSKTGDRHVKPG
jgi:hypothetical protein